MAGSGDARGNANQAEGRIAPMSDPAPWLHRDDEEATPAAPAYTIEKDGMGYRFEVPIEPGGPPGIRFVVDYLAKHGSDIFSGEVTVERLSVGHNGTMLRARFNLVGPGGQRELTKECPSSLPAGGFA